MFFLIIVNYLLLNVDIGDVYMVNKKHSDQQQRWNSVRENNFKSATTRSVKIQMKSVNDHEHRDVFQVILAKYYLLISRLARPYS